MKCEVVAPTLVPVKAGDRVKADRRDAKKLARCYRAGDLTAVWVPDAAHEALRDLVRARGAGKKDQLRGRNRRLKFLLRQGRRPPEGVTAWTLKHLAWVKRDVHFEQSAQEAALLDYFGEVEHAAARIERLDRAIEQVVASAPAALKAVIEALQSLRGIAKVTPAAHRGRGRLVVSTPADRRLRAEEATRSADRGVKEIAWKAQHRLHGRYRLPTGRGRSKAKAVTAVARELPGFNWAIRVKVEQQTREHGRLAA